MQKRRSIEPTYDSRKTGPRYHVTSDINGRIITWHQPLDDPFVRHTLHIHWRDLLRGLVRRSLTVTVRVGGDRDIVNDVLELDANALVPCSTRRDAFNFSILRGDSEAAE
ncbi:hypothetical protein OG689_10630 [Kitasatospora sp. NBC_00240]|uniref:hypothetical protein n=1 Tax=Kitasatospora sp. NBC_00240 TaxID=2903567 RepID=UPI00225641A2|nr:hypothetical protein [Kitasatospora sp. NBC_00240]MCX5209738.1 hypothetical protein [Kitasatospora sp. NBC_00240]